MTYAPEELEKRLLEPDFLAVSGSRLYGTNRASSDDDFRGFVIPPHEYVMDTAVHEHGVEDSFNDREIPGADHKVLSARRFLELTLKGDPQLTELFFVPEEKVVRRTSAGGAIIALRSFIVSNVIFKRVIGYGYSEWRKAMGEKLEVSERTKTEDAIVNDLRNLGLDKQSMDDIIDIIMSNKPRKVVPSTGNLGEKRKKEFEQFGFGVTSAAHAIRLADETTELMLTGRITFPRPNARILLDIRLGKYGVPEVTSMYEEAKAKAEEARPKSVLPDKPDRRRVLREYDNLVRQCLVTDERFLSGVRMFD